MTAIFQRRFIAAFIVLLSLNNLLFAANEQTVGSYSGSSISSSNTVPLVVEDQLRNEMLSNPNWSCHFGIKQNRVQVILRYDDARAYFNTKNWILKVTYDIKLFNNTGSTPYQTISNEVATITYSTSAAYTDKYLKLYDGAARAELTIKNVEYTEAGGATLSTVPTYRDKDIFLDLLQETERYYNLSYNGNCTTASPTVKVKRLAPAVINQGSLVSTELPIAWDYREGAESYDVEWLFIDAGDAPGSGPYGNNYKVDFRKATRVNVSQQYYNIPLAYPKGILLFRVRPIGVSYTSPYTDRVEGEWSVISQSATSISMSSANVSDYRVDFEGLDGGYNWQHKAVYAENGKHKDVVSYFDGSLRNRQTSTIVNTNSDVVIAETKYDFQGRPTVQMLPTPYGSTGIHYYSNFSSFNKNNFDSDANYPLANASVSAADQQGTYYGNNPSATGQDALLPNAQGYPYIQTKYKKDGTGRIMAQSAPGPDHRLGNGHDTRYYYGSPTQEELDRLFGNEVGNATHYRKNLILDPNGQVTVNYLDQEGRTIATALSGMPSSQNLLVLDEVPTPPLITSDLLTGKNLLSDDSRIAKSAILIDVPGKVYSFQYKLNVSQDCNPPCPSQPFCRDCSFDLSMRVTDEDGNLISNPIITPGSITYPNPINSSNGFTITPNKAEVICKNITSLTFTVQITFGEIGTYYVEKVLKLNSGQMQPYINDYIQTYYKCPGNVPVDVPVKPCNDCGYLCDHQFKRYDANGHLVYKDAPMNTIPVFTDKFGTELTPDPPFYYQYQQQGQQLINECVTDCKDIAVNIGDDCATKKAALIADMSPGGQYFDNVQNMGAPCDPTLACPNTIAPNTTQNDWLTTFISPDEGVFPGNPFWDNFRNFVQNFSSQHPAGSPGFVACNSNFPDGNLTWDWVRENWSPCYAVFMIQYHPEYCAYTYFCDDSRKLCPSPNAETLGDSKKFDKDMKTAHGVGYYNPAQGYNPGPQNPFQYGANPTSFSDYVSDLSPVPNFNAAPSVKDPYCWNYNCTQPCSTGNYSPFQVMNEYLRNYTVAHDPYNNATLKMSLWYILDDPHGIAQYGENAFSITLPAMSYFRIDQTTIDLFRSFHGDGTAANPGLLAQMTKTQIFANLYAGYKEIIFSAGLKVYDCDATTPNLDQYTYPPMDTQDPAFASCCFSLPHAQVRMPANPIYEAVGSSCPPDLSNVAQTPLVNSGMNYPTAADCYTTCASYASSWMDQIMFAAQQCNPSITLSSSDSIAMAGYLIDICTSGCDSGAPLGSSTAPSPTSAGFTTFNDVYNYFFNNPGAFPNYYCQSAVSSIHITHPPQSMSQEQCICNNLQSMANQNGLSWNGSTIIQDLYALMSTTLSMNVSYNDVQNWYQTCNSSSPDINVLNSVPDILQCEDPNTVPKPYDDCAQAAADAGYVSSLLNAQLITAMKTQYRDNFKTSCLDKVLNNESFTAGYYILEYAYTLYYYDQAGNLAKTVAPKGVTPLTFSLSPGSAGSGFTTKDVANYRAGILSNGYIRPKHTYITNYRYNGLNSVVQQNSPDGGSMIVYYDIANRSIGTQDARQYTSNLYTYTLYDELNRVTETGEFANGPLFPVGYPFTKQNYDLWISSGSNKHQIRKTYYDAQPASTNLTASALGLYTSGQITNIRCRVASVTYVDDPTAAPAGKKYDHAIHYSYDMHGNVRTLFQEDPTIINGYNLNKTDYVYDLICNKINEVHFNSGKGAQFHHKYYYDADNRITHVYTSRDGLIWEKEAKYFYYRHGPLLRTEIGDKQIQGGDYVYTIHGWTKAVNSDAISRSVDMGEDGYGVANNLNQVFAEDAYGYHLGYFNGDYVAKNTNSASFLATTTGISGLGAIGSISPSLYNGNISHMATSIRNSSYTALPSLRGFQYDQLNRIRFSRSIEGINNNVWVAGSLNNKYAEEFHYDFNGNITTLKRYENSSNLMDNLTYKYMTVANGYTINTNKLNYVTDPVSSSGYIDDIDDQTANSAINNENYKYDASGNMTRDLQAGVIDINWNAYGKIRTITKNSAIASDLEFRYDALGNRVQKIVKPHASTSTLKPSTEWTTLYYLRDAEGKVVSTYQYAKNPSTGNMELTLLEQDIYGASRIGLNSPNKRLDSDGLIIYSPDHATLDGWISLASAILAVGEDEAIDLQANFQNDGMQKTLDVIPNTNYQYSFVTGGDDVVAQKWEVRAYSGRGDTRTLLNAQTITDGTNILSFTPQDATVYLQILNTSNGTSTIKVINIGVAQPIYARVLGNKQYEFTNHLANVLTTLSDRRIPEYGSDGGVIGKADFYSPLIVSTTDYYAFGSPMAGRNFNNTYRYGFNGKEKDNEISGIGNNIMFEYRNFDSRLGRFFSCDPKLSEYPWQSTYAYYKNSPIASVDYFGLGDYYDKKGNHLGSDGKTKTVKMKNGKTKEIPDDKAYVAESVKMNDAGLVESAKNAQDLGVTNSELNLFANVIAQESGGNKYESYALGSAIMNLKREIGPTTSLLSTYKKGGIIGYYDNTNGSKYMNNAEYSMEAAINALTGGHDYSNGAIKWDGFDFAKKGLDHIKATSAGLNIAPEHMATFLMYAAYAQYSPSNPITSGMHFATGKSNHNMCLYSSVAAYGGTIFWGKNDKNFTYYGKPIINGRNSTTGPCIELPKFQPNKSFTGRWW